MLELIYKMGIINTLRRLLWRLNWDDSLKHSAVSLTHVKCSRFNTIIIKENLEELILGTLGNMMPFLSFKNWELSWKWLMRDWICLLKKFTCIDTRRLYGLKDYSESWIDTRELCLFKVHEGEIIWILQSECSEFNSWLQLLLSLSWQINYELWAYIFW